MSKQDLRTLPSVDKLLQTHDAAEWVLQYGRPLVLSAIRATLEEVRTRFPKGGAVPSQRALLQQTQRLLGEWMQPTLLAVINATGVILHTNLGRAPLSHETVQALTAAATGYTNLEYDLEKGERGSRLVHATGLLQRLTGAEDALVVNNAASAVLLTLSALAKKRRVVIARNQLVEIGGGFRIPDVMKQSGAILVEVGTTNRVYLKDYNDVIEDQPIKMVLRAHRSNFDLVGFTTEPEISELANLARRHGLPMVDDLGSGAMLDTTRFGIRHEPMVQESLSAGVDLVIFSGDKLLGGPQAGIIIGKEALVQKLKKHSLARAVRADKLCLVALSATLMHYVKNEAERKVPIWRMMAAEKRLLEARAAAWADELGQGEVVPAESTIGGGSLPGVTLPTFVCALQPEHPDRFLARLRANNPPIIARLQDDRVLLDPRTVLPEQEGALLVGLQNALAVH